MFGLDKSPTQRPYHYSEGPKPIKPVEPYRPKTPPLPVNPLPEKAADSENNEYKQLAGAAVAGSPIGVVIVVGIAILIVNCIALALIFYYHRRKLKRQGVTAANEEEPLKVEVTESGSDLTATPAGCSTIERKSRRRKQSSEHDSECNSESTSRVSSLSRESTNRKKHSDSREQSLNENHRTKVEGKTAANGKSHKRSKSESSFYNEIGKSDAGSNIKKDLRPIRTQSVKFNTMTTSSAKNLNRSTTSIASKSSVRSTSSKASLRSVSSKASVKSSASFKPVKKNASCQSLPTSDYNAWILSKDEVHESQPKENAVLPTKKHSLSVIQKQNYPKVVPDSHDIENCATLPRVRPPPPPRSTSLTARDIQELEKLQEAYRKTRSPRHTSADSGEGSGSEPFYSMGGGEAPARAPGLMYGPTLPNCLNTRRGSRKGEASDYDQYQKYQPTYQIRESPVSNDTQLAVTKPYLTYGDKAPRGPLASFGKLVEHSPSPLNFEMSSLSSISPISNSPPPVPAHQIPLTPSSLKNTTAPSYPHQPPKEEFTDAGLSSSTTMYDQSENTGTIRKQKPKSAPGTPISEAIDKPLKSALKTISAYDKKKDGSSGSTSNQAEISASNSRTDIPNLALSVSSTSSASPSMSSGGSGLPSPTELKSILVKRTPRTISSTKSKLPDNSSSTTTK